MNGCVAIAVPPKGRTAQRMLYQLGCHGYMDKNLAGILSWILAADRERINYETGEIKAGRWNDYSTNFELEIKNVVCTDEQLGDITESKPEMLKGCGGLPGLVKLCRIDRAFDFLMTYPNLLREGRPNRFTLRRYDTSVEGVPVTLIGTEHYFAADHIISGAVDIAVAGFDEIAARFASESNRNRIKRWPAFSNGEEPIILGSAGLGDYCAHIIVAKDPDAFKGIKFDEASFMFFSPEPVLVDGKYRQIYKHFMSGPDSFAFIESDDVERDAVNVYSEDAQRDYYPGIAMVNSGNSIKGSGLFCLGLPLHQSETCVLVSGEKYKHDERVKVAADSLTLYKYADRVRLGEFANWFVDVKQNIGDRWTDKPQIGKMFLDEFDKKTWAAGQGVTGSDAELLESVEASIYKTRGQSA